MTRTQVSAIALAFSALFAGQAMAQNSGPVTRDQVKAELAQAIQNGDMIVNESGTRLNEVFPHNYPQQPASTVTRAEVRAELAEAIRNGDMITHESGVRMNEIYPHNYSGTANVATKSRDEVRAELADAAAAGALDRHIEA